MLHPELLRPDHVLLGVSPYLQQAIKTSFHQWRGTNNIMAISMRMIAHQKEKRGLFCCFALPVIVIEFCHWEISHPVVLLVVHKEP